MVDYVENAIAIGTRKHFNVTAYRRRGKIRWAKCSWFQPHRSFHGNAFALPWPEVLIIQYS